MKQQNKELLFFGIIMIVSLLLVTMVYAGANKTVCAWVLCDAIKIYEAGTLFAGDKPQFKYNPRVRPNWMWEDEVIDGCWYHTMMSDSNKLYYYESTYEARTDWGKEGIIYRYLTNPVAS